MSIQSETAEARLQKIRESYIGQLPAQLEGILASYAKLVLSEQVETALEDLHRRLHTMKGACATFRLSPLSAVAMEGEQLAKEALQSSALCDGQWHQQMQEQFARIQHEIAAVDPTQNMESQMQNMVVIAEEADEREHKLVYLCEDDSYQRMTLATQISCFGFEVQSFAELKELVDAVQIAPPDAIVMDIIFPERPLGGCDTVQAIQSGREHPIPTVFISSQGSLANRLSAVRAGSSAYFVKPVNMTELCSTISLLTSAEKPEPYRVMIVDDDPPLAEYHALILEEAGMITLVVNNPVQVMAPLREFKPDLILMDMYMPGYNGMELAKAIRQIGTFFSIPIVYLSSETDIDKQFQAMQTGGDAFLTKPIAPQWLVSAVAIRAERMKIIRAQMVRDSMTGLLNHTATKEHLATAIVRAQRQHEEVCFAMIDVDKFKLVNDTYGHSIGDHVLIALARLIRQRVRKSDIVGRYGGEEFAVILPGCTIQDAISLLDKVRESFAAVIFQGKDDTFSCTFSCGVAGLSLYGDAAALNAGADEALYAAKDGGRNLVLGAFKQTTLKLYRPSNT